MKRELLIGLALLCGGLSPAVRALDLLEAYRHAEHRDARFAAARAAYNAGREKSVQGRAQLLPTVNLTGSKMDNDASLEYRGTTTFEGGDRRYDTREYELSFVQPLYRPQNFAAYRQGQAQADLAEAQFALAKQELIQRVAQVYFDLLAAQDQLALATAQKSAYLGQYEQARARLSAGAAPITEVHESKARADIATAQEIAAANEVEVRRRTFWKTTGLDGGAIEDVAAKIPLVNPDPDDMHWWMESASQNPQILGLRQNVRIAQAEVAHARGGHYPTLDFVAGHSDSRASGSVFTSASSETKVQNIGLRLQVPILQGGLVDSRIREAAANHDKAREELEDARREISVQAQQAFLAATNGIRQVEALGQAVMSSENALEASRAGLKVGVRNVVDILNATQQLYNTKRDYARARYDYLLAHLKLKATGGTLNEDDVAWINGLLTRSPANDRIPDQERMNQR